MVRIEVERGDQDGQRLRRLGPGPRVEEFQPIVSHDDCTSSPGASSGPRPYLLVPSTAVPYRIRAASSPTSERQWGKPQSGQLSIPLLAYCLSSPAIRSAGM